MTPTQGACSAGSFASNSNWSSIGSVSQVILGIGSRLGLIHIVVLQKMVYTTMGATAPITPILTQKVFQWP
ncbi:hypothetical protein, partial [Nocardia farcinica]|uniref:hypothetical protein n=1 Tax=Nocardia farcinica TaxID=37329 RepID=UPI0024572E06